MGQFAINVVSTVAAAALIALAGFLFRNKIRKVLMGLDLLALNQAPDIEFVDMQYITDLNYNKQVLFLIKNCGNVNISNIRLFKCLTKNAANPTLLSVIKLPYDRQFTSISQNDGETMQVGVDVKFFEQYESYPDVRFW